MNLEVKNKLFSLPYGCKITIKAKAPNNRLAFYQGTFAGILQRPKNPTSLHIGPFHDDYVDLENVGEKPVFSDYSANKIIAWKPALTIQSIPFSLIIDVL